MDFLVKPKNVAGSQKLPVYVMLLGQVCLPGATAPTAAHNFSSQS